MYVHDVAHGVTGEFTFFIKIEKCERSNTIFSRIWRMSFYFLFLRISVH